MVYIAGMNRPVDTGETYFGEVARSKVSGSMEARRRLFRDNIKGLPVEGGKPLEARIEHARLIVDCPNCNSAEYAFEDKLFLCSECGNSDIGGSARRVKMPKNRTEIEELLSVRPIKNRHWYPRETMKDLQSENITYGLEV